MPIVFKDSFLDQIQSLTKELFDKINEADDSFGKTWNGWNNKAGDVITENAIQEVNNMIDILEDYYTNGYTTDNSVNNGTHCRTNDADYDDTHYASHNSSVESAKYGDHCPKTTLSNCNSFGCSNHNP